MRRSIRAERSGRIDRAEESLKIVRFRNFGNSRVIRGLMDLGCDPDATFRVAGRFAERVEQHVAAVCVAARKEQERPFVGQKPEGPKSQIFVPSPRRIEAILRRSERWRIHDDDVEFPSLPFEIPKDVERVSAEPFDVFREVVETPVAFGDDDRRFRLLDGGDRCRTSGEGGEREVSLEAEAVEHAGSRRDWVQADWDVPDIEVYPRFLSGFRQNDLSQVAHSDGYSVHGRSRSGEERDFAWDSLAFRVTDIVPEDYGSGVGEFEQDARNGILSEVPPGREKLDGEDRAVSVRNESRKSVGLSVDETERIVAGQETSPEVLGAFDPFGEEADGIRPLRVTRQDAQAQRRVAPEPPGDDVLSVPDRDEIAGGRIRKRAEIAPEEPGVSEAKTRRA